MASKNCSVSGCQKNVFAKGWCSMHYKRNQRYGSPTGKPQVDTAPVRPEKKSKNSQRAQAFLIDRNSLYTMSELGKLFKMSNRALSDAAKEVRALGETAGRLAYSLPEVAQAVWGLTVQDGDEDDPFAGLKPADRKSLIESQIKYIELQHARGKYTVTDETHSYIAEKFKNLDMHLATLPDHIERECGLTPEQLSSVDREIDKMRRMLTA